MLFISNRAISKPLLRQSVHEMRSKKGYADLGAKAARVVFYDRENKMLLEMKRENKK